VLPSNALTELLCLRQAFSLSVLTGVPELRNGRDLTGKLQASAGDRVSFAELVETLWSQSIEVRGDKPDSELWFSASRLRMEHDPEHIVGRWMVREFAPFATHVLNQPFEHPADVPENQASDAVCEAVDNGLTRVAVVPLRDNYARWIPAAGVLLVAQMTRENQELYGQALRCE